MPSVGWPELIVILLLALIIFGPQRLAGVGGALGRAIRADYSRSEVAAPDVGHPDAVDTPHCRRLGVAGGAPAGVTHLGNRRARRAAGGSLVCAAPAAQGPVDKGV